MGQIGLFGVPDSACEPPVDDHDFFCDRFSSANISVNKTAFFLLLFAAFLFPRTVEFTDREHRNMQE